MLIFLLIVSWGCLVWSTSFDACTEQVVSGLLLLIPVIVSVVRMVVCDGVRSYIVSNWVILVCYLHPRQWLNISWVSDSLPVEHLLAYCLSLHRLLIILDEVRHQNIATISGLRKAVQLILLLSVAMHGRVESWGMVWCQFFLILSLFLYHTIMLELHCWVWIIE